MFGPATFADLLKAASGAHKYIRRVPTGNPKKPWRYYYTQSSIGREVTHGEEVNLGDHTAKVHEVTDKGVTIERNGKRETLTVEQWHDLMHEHHGDAYVAAVDKRARQWASAVYRHVPREMLADLKGTTDDERLADLKQRAPEVYQRLEAAFKRAGVSPEAAKGMVAWTMARRGWDADSRAALLGAGIHEGGAAVVKGYREIGQAVEAAAKGSHVTAEHVADELSKRGVKQPPAEASKASETAEEVERRVVSNWHGSSAEDKARVLAIYAERQKQLDNLPAGTVVQSGSMTRIKQSDGQWKDDRAPGNKATSKFVASLPFQIKQAEAPKKDEPTKSGKLTSKDKHDPKANGGYGNTYTTASGEQRFKSPDVANRLAYEEQDKGAIDAHQAAAILGLHGDREDALEALQGAGLTEQEVSRIRKVATNVEAAIAEVKGNRTEETARVVAQAQDAQAAAISEVLEARGYKVKHDAGQVERGHDKLAQAGEYDTPKEKAPASMAEVVNQAGKQASKDDVDDHPKVKAARAAMDRAAAEVEKLSGINTEEGRNKRAQAMEAHDKAVRAVAFARRAVRGEQRSPEDKAQTAAPAASMAEVVNQAAKPVGEGKASLVSVPNTGISINAQPGDNFISRYKQDGQWFERGPDNRSRPMDRDMGKRLDAQWQEAQGKKAAASGKTEAPKAADKGKSAIGDDQYLVAYAKRLAEHATRQVATSTSPFEKVGWKAKAQHWNDLAAGMSHEEAAKRHEAFLLDNYNMHPETAAGEAKYFHEHTKTTIEEQRKAAAARKAADDAYEARETKKTKEHLAKYDDHLSKIQAIHDKHGDGLTYDHVEAAEAIAKQAKEHHARRQIRASDWDASEAKAKEVEKAAQGVLSRYSDARGKWIDAILDGTQHAGKAGKFSIDTAVGQAEVEGTTHRGLGVHKDSRKDARGKDKTEWVVTHLNTGLALGHVTSKAEANKVRGLLLHTGIDWEKHDAEGIRRDPNAKHAAALVQATKSGSLAFANLSDATLAHLEAKAAEAKAAPTSMGDVVKRAKREAVSVETAKPSAAGQVSSQPADVEATWTKAMRGDGTASEAIRQVAIAHPDLSPQALGDLYARKVQEAIGVSHGPETRRDVGTQARAHADRHVAIERKYGLPKGSPVHGLTDEQIKTKAAEALRAKGLPDRAIDNMAQHVMAAITTGLYNGALHPENKNSRAVFEELTGTTLPKGQRDTEAALHGIPLHGEAPKIQHVGEAPKLLARPGDKGKFKIGQRDGTTVEVQGTTYGGLGIHKDTQSTGPAAETPWSITHLASGLSAGRYKNEAEANRIRGMMVGSGVDWSHKDMEALSKDPNYQHMLAAKFWQEGQKGALPEATAQHFADRVKSGEALKPHPNTEG